MTIDHVKNWLEEDINRELLSRQKGKAKPGCRSSNYDDTDSDESAGDFKDVVLAQPDSVESELSKFLPFVKHLNDCVPMSYGFHCAPCTWCYCPCGKHMRTWRERFNLEESFPECKANAKFTPDALMNHLRSGAGKTRLFHDIVSQYLKSLYGNFFPNERLDHFALYERSSKKCKDSILALKKWIANLKQVEELLQEPTFPQDSLKPSPQVPARASSPIPPQAQVTGDVGKTLTSQEKKRKTLVHLIVLFAPVS
jgi:hypothetical protein